MIELPIRRQVAFDLASVNYKLVARVAAVELHAQVAPVSGSGTTAPCPTLLIVPEAHEVAADAALAGNGVLPGEAFGVFEGFAVFLPVDRRVVTTRVPFAASVFVFDATAAFAQVSGLVWTRDLPPACACR